MPAQPNQPCPLCGDAVEQLIFNFHRAEENAIIKKIKEAHPAWVETDGVCSRCVDLYHSEILLEKKLVPEIGPYFPIRSASDYAIIPTPLRLRANPEYSGRGITICMIDSGFYPHPDISEPANRILHLTDIAEPHRGAEDFQKPQASSWHGTMTTVACTGNGYLSGGLYKSIASRANLVLLKVQKQGRISGEAIAKAIRWAIANKERYNIRIINLSVSDDEATPFKESMVDRAAEDAVNAGIVVVAAVGNDPSQSIKPPANSPRVIAVGGVNDHNTLLPDDHSLYHSTFGSTVDGFLKPDIIAPAIWIAAPILPGTPEQQEAEALHKMLEAPAEDFRRTVEDEIGRTKLDRSILENAFEEAMLAAIKERLAQAKYISPHYLHADGTSFAAPIVCSVIAQMLEANPSLSPAVVREILLATAQFMPGLPAERQGHGLINPALAVERALGETHSFKEERLQSPKIKRRQRKITFHYHNHHAESVMLCGNFNRWSPEGFLFRGGKSGNWTLELPLLPPGTYRYKFLVNGNEWISDPRNPFREPDGFNGFNSRFEVE